MRIQTNYALRIQIIPHSALRIPHSFCILHCAAGAPAYNGAPRDGRTMFAPTKLDFVQQTRKFGKPNLCFAKHRAFCILHCAAGASFLIPHSKVRLRLTCRVCFANIAHSACRIQFCILHCAASVPAYNVAPSRRAIQSS